MKKILWSLIISLLPLVMVASIFDAFNLNMPATNYSATRAYRLSEYIYSSYMGDGWEASDRNVFYYNPIHPAQVDSMHTLMWDPDMHEWTDPFMIAYITYNAAGYVIDNTILINFFGPAFPMMRVTVEYDAQNRITNLYMYSIDMDIAFRDDPPPLQAISRVHLFYDGPWINEVYNWEARYGEERIERYYKSTFVLDGQGRILDEYQFSSPDSATWGNSRRDSYTYHPQDTSTGEEFSEYASRNLPFMVMNDGFDFPGLVTEELSYDWTGSVWYENDKYVHSYNELLHRSQTDEYYFQDGMWQDCCRSLYTYDAAGNLMTRIEQDFYGDMWQPTGKYDYTWHSFTANEDPQLSPGVNMQLSAYPSPFSSEITIRTDVKAEIPVQIFNLRGQLVQNLTTDGEGSLIWNGRDSSGREVSSGLYMIRAGSGDTAVSRKVMRLKR